MVSPQCTMARVNRLTHNCVPDSAAAAPLLAHTKTGIEGGNAAEEGGRRGRSGGAAGQRRDENPRVIVPNRVQTLVRATWRTELLLIISNYYPRVL